MSFLLVTMLTLAGCGLTTGYSNYPGTIIDADLAGYRFNGADPAYSDTSLGPELIKHRATYTPKNKKLNSGKTVTVSVWSAGNTQAAQTAFEAFKNMKDQNRPPMVEIEIHGRSVYFYHPSLSYGECMAAWTVDSFVIALENIDCQIRDGLSKAYLEKYQPYKAD